MVPKKEQPGIIIDPAKIKRSKPVVEEERKADSTSVSAGPVEKAMDLAFNPTREAIKGVTVIDRMQGRLLPLLDIQSQEWEYVIEVATYRQDAKNYAVIYGQETPVPINLYEEYMYSLALWQKSVDGINLGKITDIALAEMETKAEDEDLKDGTGDPYARD